MNPFFEGPSGIELKILAQTLWDGGFKVYLAGGCVRDHLLGRAYKDLDVVTDASVEEIQRRFEKTIPVGVKFGIVRVIINGVEFEVARFRKDGPYLDGRHPEFVEFASPREDAERRDFTINALFYDLKNNIVLDYVEGKKDLSKGLLRSVGKPSERFSEDYLRILRLLRFSSQLEFKIESETEMASKNLVHHLSYVSGERVCAEMVKALSSNSLLFLQLIKEWKIMLNLIPQWHESSYSEKIYYFPIHRKKCGDDINLEFDDKSIGLLLSLLVLNFQWKEVSESIEIGSQNEWNYSDQYLQSILKLSHLFKISKKEEKVLKKSSSLFSWKRQWNFLRLGLRAFLVQSRELDPVWKMAQCLKLQNECENENKNGNVWSSFFKDEVEGWLKKPKIEPVLQGADLLFILPEKRGLALKEILYLQYEGVISNRVDALNWLKKQS